MKSQNILLLLAILAVLTRDATCAKNENEPDENEPDENEPDENEGGHKHPMNMGTSTGPPLPSSTSSASVWASTTPTSASGNWPATSASLPTGAAVSALSSVASDIAAVQSSVASAASSWVASVGNAPSATIASSSNVPAPSSSVYRPYAGPSVLSGSNHVEVSIGVATVGILAFLLTLA
ncbi:hypothetical protein [Parasitella parasitica]|uniref:Uncharacterized protein n=1 Tax=Parasitella parasitica TaxID=35722 RepID=A0A0B7MY21_9FUNG|nr:hypothetical protein [Parasitella parasitica]